MSLVAAELPPAVAAVIAAGQRAAQRGWVPATSGNFSVRIDEERVAITASGADKGQLTADDVLIAAVAGPAPPHSSAETPLHLALYAGDPAVGAVFHVHSQAATLISMRDVHLGAVRLIDYELLKALRGVSSHATAVNVPIFANTQDIPALAALVHARLGPRPAVPAYLIEGHGVYTWGRTPAEAHRHLEALDFLFSIELQRHKINR